MNVKRISIIFLFSLFLILSASSVHAQNNSTEFVCQNQDNCPALDVENNSGIFNDDFNQENFIDIGEWIVDENGNLVHVSSTKNHTAENFTGVEPKENVTDLRNNVPEDNSDQNISPMSYPYESNLLWKEFVKDPWAFMEKYHSIPSTPAIPADYQVPDSSCYRPFSKEFIDFMDFVEKTRVKPDVIESNDDVVFYSNKNSYKVRIINPVGDSVGKGVNVTFVFNGKKIHVKTDDGGYASFKFNCQPGTYSVKTYVGNISSNNKIVVKPLFKTKSFSKKYKKSAKFTIKLVKQNGKSVFKKNIKITFKGKNYNVKTNSKGIATFNIPKNLKIGKYSIKTCYNGCSVKNRIIVKK